MDTWTEYCFKEHDSMLANPPEQPCICCRCGKELKDNDGFDYKDEYYCDDCFEDVIEEIKDECRR